VTAINRTVEGFTRISQEDQDTVTLVMPMTLARFVADMAGSEYVSTGDEGAHELLNEISDAIRQIETERAERDS
jgi:hypothetical protein